MKNKFFNRVAPALSTIFVIALLQPATLRAVEVCRDIGGTGIVASGCGVGGTGNSSGKEGIGGTGHSNTAGGVGGTGIVASKSGIGGTGHIQGEGGIGGTGIVGIITGFGSIWVNGLEVQYDAKTPVVDNTDMANSKDLAIGQVVTIEASGSDNELTAHKISVVDAVAGQISTADLNRGKLTVVGQTVTITTRTITHDQLTQQNTGQLKQGDFVKVSGLRLANGEIVASRIERTGEIAEPNLVGPVTNINGNIIEVYGLKIEQVAATGLSLGQEVVVSGKMNNGILMAREITLSPSAQLYAKTGQISLQGYIGGTATEGKIKVGNLDVLVPASAISAKEKMNVLTPGELVQVSGHFAGDRSIIADKIEFSRDRPESVPHEIVSGQGREVSDKVEHADKVEHVDKAEHVDRMDRNDYIDRPDRPDRTDHDDANEAKEHSNK